MRPRYCASAFVHTVAAASLAVAAADCARADGVIAIAAPLSGAYAALGEATRGGIRDAGEVGNTVVVDDQCQAAAAVKVAHDLVAQRPAVIIGHPCSSAAIAAAPIYAAAHIPFISTGARHADLTDKRAGPLVYRLAGRDDRHGAAAADMLIRLAGGRPIAILHDRTFAMSTIAGDAAKAIAAQPGAAAVASQVAAPGAVQQFPFVASELDYEGLTAKVAALASAPQAVGAILFAGYPSEALVILRSLRARGVTAPFLGVEAVGTAEFGQSSRDLGEIYVLQSRDAAGVRLGLLTSAALRAWKSAAASASASPGAAVQATAIDDPALGRITFDAKGDAVMPSYVASAWKDGAWTSPGRDADVPIP